MQATGFVDMLPLWALYLVTVAIVLLSVEVGWRLGRLRRRRAEGEKDAPIGAVVGAALGLLAFLLAFTFGMSASRYDTRKQMVLQESNAIGTTYLARRCCRSRSAAKSVTSCASMRRCACRVSVRS